MIRAFLIVICIFSCVPYDLSTDRNKAILAVNTEYKKLVLQKGVVYIDVHDMFLADGHIKDSLYAPDGLHLLQPGYRLWADGMKGALSRCSNRRVLLLGNSLFRQADMLQFGYSGLTNWRGLLSMGQVFNYGVSGSTSSELYTRLQSIEIDSGDCVVLEIGINDIKKGVPLWLLIGNVEKIIKYFLLKTNDVFLMSLLPVRD